MITSDGREAPYDKGAWSPDEVERIVLASFHQQQPRDYLVQLHIRFHMNEDPLYAKLHSLGHEMIEGYGKNTSYGDAFFDGSVLGLETVLLLAPDRISAVDEQMRHSLNALHDLTMGQHDETNTAAPMLSYIKKRFASNVALEGGFRLRRTTLPIRRMVETIKTEQSISPQEKATFGHGFGFVLGQLEKAQEIDTAVEDYHRLSEQDFNRELARVLFSNYDSDAA